MGFFSVRRGRRGAEAVATALAAAGGSSVTVDRDGVGGLRIDVRPGVVQPSELELPPPATANKRPRFFTAIRQAATPLQAVRRSYINRHSVN